LPGVLGVERDSQHWDGSEGIMDRNLAASEDRSRR
jgi:hypothetical protein